MRTRTGLSAAIFLCGFALGGPGSPAASAQPTPSAGSDPKAEAVAAARAALQGRPDLAGLTPDTTLVARYAVLDRDGSRHVRFDTTFQGLPIRGGDLVVHLGTHGRLRGVDRAMAGTVRLDADPAVPAPQAAHTATVVTRVQLPASHPLRSVPRLVVDAQHGTPRLAWESTVEGHDARDNPTRRVVLTDADTGALIATRDAIPEASRTVSTVAAGTGYSLYSGRVTLTTYREPTAKVAYQLRDPALGNLFTGDALGRRDECGAWLCQTPAPAVRFRDADNVWGTGTFAGTQSAAVDAQYGAAATWNYYLTVHGRRGIADNGVGSYSRVHYGRKYNNAFWDDSCFCMTYGDGDGVRYGPLVSLDITAHEMTHGITARTAGLLYEGESGGLNEATSDIFGTLVEFQAHNAKDVGDYMIGERVLKHGGAFRYLDRPSRDGASPDCWTSGLATLDVHYSSGVANHFFYLASEGGGVKTLNGVRYSSPTCDSSTVSGIGRATVGAVWYRALTVYMTSTTDYAGARVATLRAAADLYGEGSRQYATIAAAWSAVRVG